MAFKDALQDDLDNVFFDIEEFAEEHEYNGSKIPVVFDEDKLMQFELTRQDARSDGIFEGKILLYIKKSDLDDEPFAEQHVTLDSKHYIVDSVKYIDGLYMIILGDYES